MHRFRPRITLRRLMVVVAVAALVSLVSTSAYRHDGITDPHVVIPVACFISAAYGVGSIRRPLEFFLPLMVIWIVTPTVDHPSPDVINVSATGCYLGWIIGAPVGWISRALKRLDESPPVANYPPEPE